MVLQPFASFDLLQESIPFSRTRCCCCRVAESLHDILTSLLPTHMLWINHLFRRLCFLHSKSIYLNRSRNIRTSTEMTELSIMAPVLKNSNLRTRLDTLPNSHSLVWCSQPFVLLTVSASLDLASRRPGGRAPPLNKCRL